MAEEFQVPQCSKGLKEMMDTIGKSIETMRNKLRSFDLSEAIVDPALGLTSVECPSAPYIRRSEQPTRLERLQKACFDLNREIERKDRELKCLNDLKDPQLLSDRELNKLKTKNDDLEEQGAAMKYIKQGQCILLEKYKKEYESLKKTVDNQGKYIEKMEEKYQKKEEKMKMDIQKMQQKYKMKLDEMIDCPENMEKRKSELEQVEMDKKKLLCKILILYNEFKNMKERAKKKKGCESVTELKYCQEDYKKLLKHHQDILQEKEMLEAELEKTKNDYISHKKESACNITRMKLHSSCEMQNLLHEIATLEEELDSFKQWNCCEKAQRYELFKDMKAQVQQLAFNMNSTQKQVHTLKDKLNNMPLLSPEPKSISCDF